jgi:periplasmic divalent cation tolerance protein
MSEALVNRTDQLGVVLVTAGSESEADQLAQLLVRRQLAACVSISPIRSVYTWQGEIQNDREWQLVIKTNLNHMEEIATLITRHHSYEVPEVIGLPIQSGLTDYLNWLTEQVHH